MVRFSKFLVCCTMATSLGLTACAGMGHMHDDSNTTDTVETNNSTNSLVDNWSTSTAQDVVDMLASRGFTDVTLKYVDDDVNYFDVSDLSQHYESYYFIWGPDDKSAWLGYVYGGHLQMSPTVINNEPIIDTMLYEDPLLYRYDFDLGKVVAETELEGVTCIPVDRLDADTLMNFSVGSNN